MPQLDPTWFASQLFWLAITFALLYAVMAAYVLPAIRRTLEHRRQTLAGDVEQAQSAKTQAEEAKQVYEKALAEARSKAQALAAEAMLAHKARMEQAGRDMDAQTAKKLAEAERRIETRKQELIEALTPTAAELTGMIVEKLTQRTPGNDTVQAILSELSKAKNG